MLSFGQQIIMLQAKRAKNAILCTLEVNTNICHLPPYLCVVACNDVGSGHYGVVVMAQSHRETEKEGSGGL